MEDKKRNQERQQTAQTKCHHCGQFFNSQEELRRHEATCIGQSKPKKS